MEVGNSLVEEITGQALYQDEGWWRNMLYAERSEATMTGAESPSLSLAVLKSSPPRLYSLWTCTYFRPSELDL